MKVTLAVVDIKTAAIRNMRFKHSVDYYLKFLDNICGDYTYSC